jgi:hypothetical protein
MEPRKDINDRPLVIPASVLQTLTRPSFFSGRLLTADDLRREQEYVDSRRHLQNLATLGPGIVTGLAVSEEPGGKEIRVAAGYAVDPWGREIIVPADVCVPWPAAIERPPRRWGVVIEYAEQDIDPVPTANGPMASTVSERYSMTVLTEPPDRDDTRVVLRPFGGRRRPVPDRG